MDESKNLHLFFSDLVVETRLFKEAEYTLKNAILSHVYALGLLKNSLSKKEQHSSGLEILRIKLVIESARNWAVTKFKIIRMIFIVLSLVQYGLYACRVCYRLKTGTVSIHNLALLPLGCCIKLIFRVKLIYLPHELETERSGVRGILKFLMKIAEKCCIGYASHTVTVCPPITQWYMDLYQIRNVHTVRNVPAKRQLAITNDVTDIREKFNILDDELVFIYQGLLSEGRGIALVIESFQRAKKKIVLMGHGDLAREIQDNSSKYISYLKPVLAHNICAQTAKADVGIHINQDESLSYKYSLPNKFFEYVHAGIPIIVSPNMEFLSDLVVSHNLGWVIDPENLADFLLGLELNQCADKRASLLQYASSAVYENDAKAFKTVYSS